MVSGLRLGTFPSKVMVPVIDAAAMTTPGQAKMTARPAVNHTFP